MALSMLSKPLNAIDANLLKEIISTASRDKIDPDADKNYIVGF